MFCSGNALSWWSPLDEEPHRIACHALALGGLRVALGFLDAQPTEDRHQLLGRGAVLSGRDGTGLAEAMRAAGHASLDAPVPEPVAETLRSPPRRQSRNPARDVRAIHLVLRAKRPLQRRLFVR